MTPEAFRRQFKHIVHLKGRVTRNNNYIKTLTRYDKEGSHKEAIKKAIQLREQSNKEYKASLRGRSYEEWLETSSRLSTLNSQLKKTEERIKVIEKEIKECLDF